MSKLSNFRDEIIDLYTIRGLSLRKIAGKFNCSYPTIGRLLKKNNVRIRAKSEARLGKTKLEQYKEEIIDLYDNQGLTTIEIAKEFNCSHSIIGSLLKNNNVKIRGRWCKASKV